MPPTAFSENLPREGEPVPWFRAPCGDNPNFAFDTVGGRWIMLIFFGALRRQETRTALERIAESRVLFDNRRAALFGVSVDPADSRPPDAVRRSGLRYFLDFDRCVSRRYGVAGDGDEYRPTVFLLDPLLRVVRYRPLEDIKTLLDELRDSLINSGIEDALRPPVLIIPRIFEPDFCKDLIEYFHGRGGQPSGIMLQVENKTHLVHNGQFKRRADVELEDARLVTAARERIAGRLAPLIERTYGWRPSRIERYLVACYEAKGGGFFRAHRDNTTTATAHRRLAVTINLNSDDYEGGDLTFPEFGSARFRPQTGAALVFGCGMLHEVLPVTRGRRFAFLPFLYDDAAAQVRDQNRSSLA